MADPFQTFFKQLSRKDASKAHALLDAHPEFARTPQALLEACHRGKADIVRRLLEGGAEPDVRSSGTPGAWRTPIQRAVEATNGKGGWTEAQRSVFDQLVAAGADLNQRSSFGMYRPLGHAILAGNVDAVVALLEAGVRPDVEERCGLGELPSQGGTGRRVSGRGHFYTVVRPLDLCAGSRLGRHDEGRRGGLMDVARALLQAGESPGAWVHDEQTFPGAADGAAHAGNAAVLQVVLEAGASAQACLASGLHGNHPAVLEVLGRYPLDADAVGDASVGTRLVHEEARWGRPWNCVWLVDRGANPNRPDGWGRTPLHYAARRGVRPDWFAAMHERGARLDVVDGEGLTPLDIAVAKKKKTLAAWLRERS